jgi:hypothetical protein
MPTEREPDAVAVMVSAVPAMAPVDTPVAVPAGQYVPAGHCSEHNVALRLCAAP